MAPPTIQHLARWWSQSLQPAHPACSHQFSIGLMSKVSSNLQSCRSHLPRPPPHCLWLRRLGMVKRLEAQGDIWQRNSHSNIINVEQLLNSAGLKKVSYDFSRSGKASLFKFSIGQARAAVTFESKMIQKGPPTKPYLSLSCPLSILKLEAIRNQNLKATCSRL